MYDENLEVDMDLGIPECLIDIYTLDRTYICNHPNIQSSRDSQLKHIDDRNIIPITISDCKIKNIPTINLELCSYGNRKILCEELMCSACGNPTFFIRKIRNNYLCPSCAMNKMEIEGIPLRPNCCDLPTGCDSCGGIVNRMIEIKRANKGSTGKTPLLLCLRDECLMPFGYCLPSETDFACTCDVDILSDLETEGTLIDDLVGMVSKFYVKSRPRGARKEMVLADLHMTRKDRCLPCQISSRYQVISGKSTDWEIVKGRDVTCSCNIPLFSSGSISCRRGSSSLSTPVSSSNFRRIQSSGDLMDEYTDSTSEI
jgi:hypothetical protein